jgi:hypothetical protein
MNRIILIASLLLFWLISNSQEISCKKFKTGKFQNIEDGVVKSKIERNDSIQIEEYGENKIKLKIEWLNDCTHRLIFLEGNDSWWESRGRSKPSPDLIVHITIFKRHKIVS